MRPRLSNEYFLSLVNTEWLGKLLRIEEKLPRRTHPHDGTKRTGRHVKCNQYEERLRDNEGIGWKQLTMAPQRSWEESSAQ